MRAGFANQKDTIFGKHYFLRTFGPPKRQTWLHMAKNNTSNALFWAVIIVGVFLLAGNWNRVSGWFGGKKDEAAVWQPTEKPAPAAEKPPNQPQGNRRPATETALEKQPVKHAFENRTDFAYPTGGKYAVVAHTKYTLGYAEKYEQPAWVAYRLTAEMVTGKNKRKDNFRPDPKVATGSAVPADYRGSGYDRGHLAPVADFKADAGWMDETFFMSNMSPQVHEFNAGIWEKLEAATRGWAKRYQSVYVVAGPVLRNGLPTIGKNNRVAVPEKYYKVILDMNQPKAIAFIMKNEGSQNPLRSFAVSIDEVERQTGLDFFPQLPDDLETKLESQQDMDAWSAKAPGKKAGRVSGF